MRICEGVPSYKGKLVNTHPRAKHDDSCNLVTMTLKHSNRLVETSGLAAYTHSHWSCKFKRWHQVGGFCLSKLAPYPFTNNNQLVGSYLQDSPLKYIVSSSTNNVDEWKHSTSGGIRMANHSTKEIMDMHVNLSKSGYINLKGRVCARERSGLIISLQNIIRSFFYSPFSQGFLSLNVCHSVLFVQSWTVGFISPRDCRRIVFWDQ